MWRNVIHLASGAVLAQVLLVASTPILTRIFNAEAFGIFAVFSAAYAIAIPIFTMKYDVAVILPKSNRGAIGISALVVFIASSFALVFGGLLWLAVEISFFPQANELNVWLPLALWLGALYTLTIQWSARQRDYKDFARSQVFGAVINIVTSLALGLWFDGQPEHLIIGFVCGMAGSFGYMWLSRPGKLSVNPKLSVPRLFRRAVVYRQFPALVLPATLLMIIGQSSLPLILTVFYSIKDVGQFAIANRLLIVPAALIGNAVWEVFRSEFFRRQRDRVELSSLVCNTLRTLTILAIPIFGILGAISPWLFSLVFGAEYDEAGYLARAMILGVATQFICNPFSSVFVALRRNRIGLQIQFATTFLPLALLIAAAVFDLTLKTALVVYAAGTAVSMTMMLLIALSLIRASDCTIKVSKLA